jgi:hypothetical protein
VWQRLADEYANAAAPLEGEQQSAMQQQQQIQRDEDKKE